MSIITGVSYMGHHNPRYLAADFQDLAKLGCDDVLIAAQENDFVYMRGKLDFTPTLARDVGLRPLAIFWGALNVFGGGKSSQFLLEHPDCHQVRRDDSVSPQGCYNQKKAVERIQDMIDRIAELGFAGYFVDEPTPLDCYCTACQGLYESWYGGDLKEGDREQVRGFRARCVTHYIKTISSYIKRNHSQLETMVCLMPCDRGCWEEVGKISELDNLGTDIYWVNDDRDVEEMNPLLADMEGVCKKNGKIHHEWLQCWGVTEGREDRITEQGEVLLRRKPDALYVWAYLGQIGTSESCGNPGLAWEKAASILRRAKED